jgi:hypothetical protein
MTYNYLKKLIGLSQQDDIDEKNMSYESLVDVAFSLIDSQRDPFDYVLDDGKVVFLSGRGVEISQNKVILKNNIFTKQIPDLNLNCETVWKLFSSFKNSSKFRNNDMKIKHNNTDKYKNMKSNCNTKLSFLRRQNETLRNDMNILKNTNNEHLFKIMELEANLKKYKSQYTKIQQTGITEKNVSELNRYKKLLSSAQKSWVLNKKKTK